MTRTLSILVFVFFALALGACGGEEDARDVHVRDFRLVEAPSGDRQVMGTLHNAGSKDIENAQVQVTLFDGDNVRIETMNVPVSDIPASGEVEFKQALDTEADVEGARVQSVLVM